MNHERNTRTTNAIERLIQQGGYVNRVHVNHETATYMTFEIIGPTDKDSIIVYRNNIHRNNIRHSDQVRLIKLSKDVFQFINNPSNAARRLHTLLWEL